MAKANPDEVEKLRKFMADLEETIDDVGLDGDYRNLGEWVCTNFPAWWRVVEGYPILVESACDPALSYLDWKPDLKRLIEASSTGWQNELYT
jgi:hypothetical protein